MKRIIYKPANNEAVPDGSMFYTLPVNGAVIDAIVADDFVTTGVVLYDSLSNIPVNVNGELVLVNPIMLNEQFIHHFSGWEV